MDVLKAAADPLTCARIITILYGLSVALTFAEKLVLSREYALGGWFSWRIVQFDRQHLRVFRQFPDLGSAFFGRVGVTVALGVGLFGVALVWMSPVRSMPFTAGMAATVAACLMGQFRSSYGGDGSQQMNLIIGVSILLGFNPWVRAEVGALSLVFIAAESCFAYFTSGVAKLVSPIWMRGDPLVGILSTTAYGSPLGLRLVMGLAGSRRAFAVSMVALEASFPLAVIGPAWVLAGYLAWGLAFHVANAVFMGLNTFLWSFLATYPAICFAWVLLH